MRGASPERIRSREWRAKRRAVIARDPVCRRCWRRGSAEADHIIARADGGTDDMDNLQGVCRYCHASKTARESAARRRKAMRDERERYALPAGVAKRKLKG